MTRRHIVTLTAILMISALGLATQGFGAPVRLNAAEIQGSGIVLETLRPVRFRPHVSATGIVLDPTAVLRLRGRVARAAADRTAAEAKLTLAVDTANRAAVLYRERQNISAAKLESAQAGLAIARADDLAAKAELRSVLGEVAAQWGYRLAVALRQGDAFLPALTRGRVRLVGVGLPPGVALAKPPKLVTASATSGPALRITLIGPVPEMIGGLAGQSFLYIMSVDAETPPIGTVLSVPLPEGASMNGVRIPSRAVIWQDGKAIVYRALGHGEFARVPIATQFPTKDGYFVSTGLAPGERIVIGGASLLLGASTNEHSHAAPDDDD